MKGFASDNNSGVHPQIMKALAETGNSHAIAYGGDELTQQAELLLKKTFGQQTQSFFVFNGTAANVTGLSAILKPYNAVICAETSHINCDECGAPEKIAGCKLLTVKTDDGKLKPEMLGSFMHAIGFQHHSQPSVISISQTTELGTVYTIDEIRQLANYAHSNNMLLHIDGARISNAAAALGCSLSETTIGAGADMLSFGGTKNGLMFGEAVVFFQPQLADNFMYIRKQNMQLASKMRYISAQFIEYIETGLWQTNALHANKMAKLLAQKIEQIPQIKITQKVEANGVFALVPREIIERLQKEYFFYVWNEDTAEVRWMTSWDTTEDDINNFTSLIKKLLT